MAINFRSVVTSGLVAGIAIIASAFLMVPIVGDQMNEALAARGLLRLAPAPWRSSPPFRW
jgi:hypothetical protein